MQLPGSSPLGGIILVDKPAGVTSHDVVDEVRRLFGVKRVGHCGTLDKPASGLLVTVLGRTARCSRFIQEAMKQYYGTIVFGRTTDTDDAAGNVLEESQCYLTEDAVRAAVEQFEGEIEQLPPRRSAIKMQGKRLYKLDLGGVDFDLPVRKVYVDRIELIAFDPASERFGGLPAADIAVTCGSGTYIRSLARDVGERLGCGAHLGSLVRTAVGDFHLDNSWTLGELKNLASQGKLSEAVLEPIAAFRQWKKIEVRGELKDAVIHGRVLTLDVFSGGEASTANGVSVSQVLDEALKSKGRLALVDSDGRLLAVAQVSPDDRSLRYLVVLSGSGLGEQAAHN